MPMAVQAVVIVCAAAAVAAAALVYLVRPGRAPAGHEWFKRWHYAHRGLFSPSQQPPENSLAAFEAAIGAGYGFELDVALTADQQVIVFHDDTLRRLCGVEGWVWQQTAASLAPLRLAGSDQAIPLFADVLALTNGQVPIIVEVKPSPLRRQLCEQVARALDDYTGPVCVESFDPRIVHWFRRNRPRLLRGQLAGRRDPALRGRRLEWFLLRHLWVNVLSRPHFIAYRVQDADGWMLRLCRRLGASAVAWTVRDQSGYLNARRRFDAMIFEPWPDMPVLARGERYNDSKDR